MGLHLYKKKRNFSNTPEPDAHESSGEKKLHFVVQKHDASHLHYDFRLEIGGVLKSWAVPKGPSMNPEDKRLAVMVEDHPYAYKDFEGIIPPGNYGAGTVIIWDQGFYEPVEAVSQNKKLQEKWLNQELKKGDLKIFLHGKKLKGEFALVHTKIRGEKSWLLIKKHDEYALSSDITKKDKSVVSGITIGQLSKTDPTVKAKTK
jgi:bifunctional non-homologous end joining protein LigD